MIFNKLEGTTATSFKIGKGGPTIYQGTANPVTSPPSTNLGDLYLRTGGTPGLWQYVGGQWSQISGETGYADIFNGTSDWSGPTGGYYTITIPEATHLQGVNPLVEAFDSTTGTYAVVTPDSLAVDGSGNVTISVTSSPDNRFPGKIVISAGLYTGGVGGGNGTVTSLGLTSSGTITVGGTPSPITTTGTFTVDVNQANLNLADIGGSLNLTSQVSGVLPIGSGGTNNSAFTSDAVIYFDGTKLNSVTPGTNGQVLSLISGAPAWETLPPASTPFVVNVNKVPGAGQFSSISTAVASISTASEMTPYVVQVAPGVYIEPQITLKPWVQIVCEPGSSMVVAANPNAHLIIGAENSAITGFILTGVTGTGYAAIQFSGTTGTLFRINGATITNCYYHYLFNASAETQVALLQCLSQVGPYDFQVMNISGNVNGMVSNRVFVDSFVVMDLGGNSICTALFYVADPNVLLRLNNFEILSDWNQLTGITLNTAGSGYNVGDTITLQNVGGVMVVAPVIQITGLTGGPGTGVSTFTITVPGQFSQANPVSFTQASTSGSGTGATFQTPTFANSSLGHQADGVHFLNGATFSAITGYINGMNNGIVNANVGAGSIVEASNITIDASTTDDIVIANPNTTGFFTGAANYLKTNVDPSASVTITLSDDRNGGLVSTGSVYLGRSFNSLTETLDFIKGQSLGIWGGGSITVVSGLTVSISEGFGFLAQGSYSSFPNTYELYRINWSTQNLVLPANSNLYLYFDYTSTLQTAPFEPSLVGTIFLGRVVTGASSVLWIDSQGVGGSHMANDLDYMIRNAVGPLYVSGSAVTEDATPFKLDVGTGNYYFSTSNFTPTGGTPISWNAYYQNAGLLTVGISAAGSGYNIGDQITITGSSVLVDPIVEVQTLTGGPGTGVATVSVISPGQFSNDSATSFTQVSTTGSGVGAAFNAPDWVGVWTYVSQNTVDNAYYNSGTGLVAIPSGEFTKHVLYTVGQGANEEYLLVYGNAAYASLSLAEGAANPTPPTQFSGAMPTIAAICVQQGASNILATGSILDIRPILSFRAGTTAGTTVHGDLLGLTADDHHQYLLVNGTRNMAADLNMGGYNVDNAGSYNGVTVEAHESRHLPNGADPLTTAAPTTSLSPSSTNAVGIQNSLARSDHSHAITGFIPSSELGAANGVATLDGTSKLTTSQMQTVTLSGNVTGSGTTSITTTIPASTITYAMIQNEGADTLLGNPTGSSAAPSEITLGSTLNFSGSSLNVNQGNLSLGSIGGTLNLTSQVTGTLPISHGGTNNSSAYTAGSLIFSNGSSLAQDNANLYWNDSNLYLGIGTNAPLDILHMVVSTAGSTRHVFLDAYGTNNAGFRSRTAQGTVSSPSASLSGNALGTFGALGYGASQFATSNTGAMAIHANETFTNTSNATYMRFLTTPTGSVSAAERLRINSTGNILIGTTTDAGQLLQVAGSQANTVSSTTALTVNGTTLVVDTVNNAVGIGTQPATNAVLDIVNNSGSTKAIQTTGYGSNVGFRARYANGTLGSPTATLSGNILSFFSGRGYGTSQFAASSTGAININAAANFTNISMPTSITFSVTPVNSVTSAQAMEIAPTGNVLIGTATDNAADALQFASGFGVYGNYFKFAGTTSGVAEIIAPSTITSYTLSLPIAQGAASSYLQNDGSGNLSWTTGTPPTVATNIDGGNSSSLYTTPQLISGGTA